MTTKIFVGNLSNDATVPELKALFAQFGNVVECDIMKHFGFVHMEVEEEALAAIDALNGYNLKGSKMNVELSTGKNLHGRRRTDNPSAPPSGGRGRGRRPDGRPQPYSRGGRGSSRGGVRGGRGGHSSYDNDNGYESFDRDAMYDELYNEVYRDAYMQAYKDLCREMASREVAAEVRKAAQAVPAAAAAGEPYRRPPPEYYEQGSSSRPTISSRPGPEAVKYPGLESSYSSGYQAAAAPRYAAPRGPPMRPPMMRGGYNM